ncbi:uncharacterized protein [Aristolochia californica]|uniref:uncharacterized protein isoform X1 n=1 Tax=Aristolochia californica TaxID=171875 RepID=UPI0035DA3790
MSIRSRVDPIISSIVSVHPHEMSALIHSALCFFFILSAYFLVLPLRDEGAISLGLANLPGLFLGSLVLTLVAAPVTTVVFSFPNLSKGKALVLILRLFSISLVIFFILWHASSHGSSFLSSKDATVYEDKKVEINQESSPQSSLWHQHEWFYVSVRVSLFLWVALLNLITISSTWARVIDVMSNESGSRLFGFVGAGATLGQLLGSLFAAGMAWLGPSLLLVAALLMELAAQSSKGIDQEVHGGSEELSSVKEAVLSQQVKVNDERKLEPVASSLKSSSSVLKPQLGVILDGLVLILSSRYLLYISLFLWLSAVVSSFFYFQKVTIIASTVASPVDRRRLLAEINSFIALFILTGQLTITGRILTFAGVTTAICSAPFVALLNMVALASWPTWTVVAISETLRKVVTYVVTRPGRELLFTVVTEDEKYKAKVCIDVIVQRLGDATAAGLYKLLFSTLDKRTSTSCLYVLPVCFFWIVTAFHLGRQQEQLAKFQRVPTS